jgi:hypothetical protein
MITTGICAPCGRGRYRFQASFRQARILAFWRLGFRQCGFHHIARISRHAAPYAWARLPVSWHAIFPFHLSDHGSAIRSKDTSSSPCPLRGLYSSAPRGARRSSRSARLPSRSLLSWKCRFLLRYSHCPVSSARSPDLALAARKMPLSTSGFQMLVTPKALSPIPPLFASRIAAWWAQLWSAARSPGSGGCADGAGFEGPRRLGVLGGVRARYVSP